MGIKTILTTQLEHIHLSLPSNGIAVEPSSIVSVKSPKRSRRKERKRHVQRQIFVPDKPPFVNYASAHIDPYRSLTPIPKDHYRRFHSAAPRKKRSTKNSKDTEESSVNFQIEPIELWPSNPDSFDMDFIRQRQISIDNSFLREKIDAWKVVSFEHLLTLMRELITDQHLIDCVWIIFYWICQHISYDQEKNEQKIDEILHSGKANSEGYANMFDQLCQKFGIQSVQIPGYVKDVHFHFNQTSFSRINHTWNAVKLGHHHWYLLDCCWGSGYLTNKQIYKRSLQTFYFLTRPEQLIYDHFPRDSQWQCLSKPISMSDYLQLPYLHSFYFIFNLTLISPRFSPMVLFDRCESLAEVLIQAPNDIQLTCASKDENQSTSLTQYDTRRRIWQCFFAPARSGVYTLMIFANRLSRSSSSLVNVMELGVEIPSQDFHRRKILPFTFGEFLEYKCQIISPLEGVLKRGKKILIHCRIPQAYYGRISLDGIWLDDVYIKDGIFKQEILVPQHEILLYAQFLTNKSSNKNYSALIRYLVEE